MNTMRQYPERDPGQSLEDQHRIHTHNIKNFAAILESANDLKMVPIEYIAFKEKAFKALHLYMMFGSHENYSETCKVFTDFIDHHQMCFSQQKLQELKDNQDKAVSSGTPVITPEFKNFSVLVTEILTQVIELQKHVANEKALFSKDTFELLDEARRKLVSVTNSIFYDSQTRSLKINNKSNYQRK